MKNKIAVVTDSACDLSREYIDSKENLFVLPLRISIGEESVRDGIDISTEEILKLMETGSIPKTSLPSPEEAEAIFEKLISGGFTQVMCVHISSGLSGTIAMMRLIAGQYKDALDVRFFDTKILSMSEGYMVMKAVELIENGVAFEALCEKMEEARKDVDGYFYIPTLKYLAVGGRIGGVAKYLGNLMNIRPIIGCDGEGKYYPRHITIGAKRILQAAKEECRDFIGALSAEITVLHAGAPEEAQKLAEVIRSVCASVKLSVSELTPALSVHVGRGMIAVCTRRFA